MSTEDENEIDIYNESDIDRQENESFETDDDEEDEQIELNEEDLRELERLSDDRIPDIFKAFTINDGSGSNIAARTTDFSEKGLRIAIDGKHNLKANENILLNTLTGNLQLAGEIKYCLRTNTRTETSYLGIHLQKTHSIAEYIHLINESSPIS